MTTWGVKVRRVLPGLVCAVAVLVLGWAWSVASPPASSPDEEYHLASIWCPMPYEAYGCQTATDGQGQLTVDVPEAVGVRSLCWQSSLKTTAECTSALSSQVQVPTWRVDQGGYPGGMYKALHLLVGADTHSSLLAMRMLTVVVAVLLGAGVVVVGGRTVRRLLVYTVLGSYLPLGVSMVASMNPSGWSLIGVTTAFLGMVCLAYADQRWRVVGSAVLVAAGALLAGSARSDAGPYLVVAGAAAVVIYHRQFRTHLLRLLVPGLLAVWGAVVLLSSSQIGAMQTPAVLAGIDVSHRNARLTFFKNLDEILSLVIGNYGTWPLAQLDAPMPSSVYVPALAVAAGLCLVGLRQVTLGKLLVIGTVAALLVALPLYLLQVSLLYVNEVIQPRYVLPLLPVLVGSCVAPVFGRQLSLTRLQALTVWLAVSVAHCSALLAFMRRFAVGTEGAFFLGAPDPWTWPGAPAPVWTWTIGSVAFAVAAFSVVLVSEGPGAAGPPATVAGRVPVREHPAVEEPRPEQTSPVVRDLSAVPGLSPVPEPSLAAGEASAAAPEPSPAVPEPSPAAGEASAAAPEPSLAVPEPSPAAGEASAAAPEPDPGEPAPSADLPVPAAAQPAEVPSQPGPAS